MEGEELAEVRRDGANDEVEEGGDGIEAAALKKLEFVLTGEETGPGPPILDKDAGRTYPLCPLQSLQCSSRIWESAIKVFERWVQDDKFPSFSDSNDIYDASSYSTEAKN